MTIYLCDQCDQEFDTEPVVDAEATPDNVYCSVQCQDNYADRVGGNVNAWWD